jgi:Tfp pilus assembly protein PilO
MDILTKSAHLLFIFYALFIGMEYQGKISQQSLDVETALNVAEAKIKKSQRNLVAVKKFRENLEDSKKRVKEVVAKIEEMQRQLPSDIQDTVVTGTITEFANDLKMIKPSAAPKGEIDHKFYISKEYQFSTQGTFLQSLIFFEKLENLAKSDRILNVKYVRMVNSETADPRSRFKILELTTTLEAYRYNNSYDPTKDI